MYATQEEPAGAVLVTPGAGVGLSNPHLSLGRRRMLDLVNKLHSTGVQVDIDLPQIAVIGNQSAGKSSLIESISGITLPRAAGTCTRCPTECRLSKSDNAWKCVVSLRFIQDSDGQTLGQVRNEVFGDPILDKTQVEERIRRAQRAILNPSRSAKTFLQGESEDDEPTELSFSINCVSLQISGPDVADLSFCDLPGLIASVGSSRGGSNDIKLVQSLVTSYIKKPSCIILLTVACETDFENQGAHQLAKQYDPDGKRTIGVLTKPDRIPTGEESAWLPFIRNEKEPLDNNWYCVKQPSSNEIKQDITWEDARLKERDFFSMTPPWSELDPMYQKYLKTSNLVERLSSILSDLISKRLPQIQDELDKSILEVRNLLSALPRPPSSDATGDVLGLMHEFGNALRSHVRGVPDTDGLIQSIRPAQHRFRKAIRSTAPNFRPFERKYARTRHLSRPDFLDQEEGPCEGESSDVDVDNSDDEAAEDDSSSGTSGRKRKHSKTTDNKIYIDEVLTRANHARTRELPGNYPFVVQETFIKSATEQWREPAMLLCQTTYNTLTVQLKNIVKKHFGSFGQGHLEQRVRTILQQHLKDCFEQAQQSIDWVLSLEEMPFSTNEHYFSDYREKFLSHYRSTRHAQRNQVILQTINNFSEKAGEAEAEADGRVEPFQPADPQLQAITRVLSGLAEMGFQGLTASDLVKLLPPDEMEPALIIMADVRAYFQVAYKRFTDLIPMTIDKELVMGMQKGALDALYTSLGIKSKDGYLICQELAQESPQIADRRAELVKKLERLEVANQQLLNMGM